MNRLFLIFGLWAALCVPALAQFNGGGFGQPGFTSPKAVGGAAPTWTPTDAQENDACGFVTTCPVPVTGVIAGFVVVGAGGNTGGSLLDNTTGVSICGTNLTRVATTGLINSNDVWDLWAGTIACSGSQTVSVTTATANSTRFIGVTMGTLANLTSTTATITCNGSNASLGATQACSSSITIPSSGFGICTAWQNAAVAVTFVSPISTDKAATGASSASGIGNSAVAASPTPSFNSSTFSQGGLVCGTWH